MEMRPQDGLSGLPHNTAVKQQQLPACRLHLWAPGVLSAFFAIGLVCLGLGIILILSAKNVKEIEGNVYIPKTIWLLPEPPSIHSSRSDSQLLGKDIRDVKNCSPFEKSHNGTPITPCGAVADSMFNDTIILSYNLNSSIHIQVSMLRSGITWWTDKYVKFKNPSSSNLSSAFAGTTKPPGWPKPVYDLDEEDLGNNGFVKDDFIVCMRAAAFPTFKKLYHCLSQIQYFIEGLPAGNYSFHITYNFPVTRFQGRKAVVLSTLMWSGGSGLFLGLAYSVTGAMKWLAFFLMMPVHLRMKKRKTFFLQQ